MAEPTFSAEEKAAIKARAAEVKAQQKAAGDRDKAERALFAVIEAMPDDEARIARRLHEIVTAAAPQLMPKTFYGSPGWALDGKVLCFYQNPSKYTTRYGSFGFQEIAHLDDGVAWPTAWALVDLDDAMEALVADLVRRAVDRER